MYQLQQLIMRYPTHIWEPTAASIETVGIVSLGFSAGAAVSLRLQLVFVSQQVMAMESCRRSAGLGRFSLAMFQASAVIVLRVLRTYLVLTW